MRFMVKASIMFNPVGASQRATRVTPAVGGLVTFWGSP